MASLEILPGKRPQKDATPGANQFPTGTAGSGTFDGDTSREGFYSCQQCGMWCLQSRVQSPGGSMTGNGNTTVSVLGGVGDPTVSRGGCPFCGTLNSLKG